MHGYAYILILFILSYPPLCYLPPHATSHLSHLYHITSYHSTSTSSSGPVVGPQPHVAEASLPRHGGGPEAAVRSRRERPGLQQRPHPRPSHRLLQHGPGPVDALLLQPPHGWANVNMKDTQKATHKRARKPVCTREMTNQNAYVSPTCTHRKVSKNV